MSRVVAITIFALAIWSAPAAAAAEEPVYSFGPVATWAVLAGPAGGGSFGSPGGGGYLGGELSVSRLSERFWFGAYLDGAYDFGHEAAVFTAGPGLGWGFFGLDGGLAARVGDSDDLGTSVRFLLTSGFFAISSRWLYFPENDEHVGQVGVILKFPLWASGGVTP